MAVIDAPLSAAKRITLRGAFYTRTWRGLVVASIWPRKRAARRSLAQLAREEYLVALNTAILYASVDELQQAMDATKNSGLLWRDALTSQYAGHQIAPIQLDGIVCYPESFVRQVRRALDTLAGSITGPVYRATDAWRANRPAQAGTIFTSNGEGQNPSWT